jgi:hypothetical protein
VNSHSFFVALLLFCAALKLAAQGTAFNYQGRLSDGGVPANGAYDLRFGVYNAVTNGSAISYPLTNAAVAVSNGLFGVTLDFGAGIFTGTNYWMDIGVRTNGGTNFTALFPRQPILPVPYAIFANTASNLLGKLTAAQFSGNLPASQVTGASSNVVSFTNLNNAFSGTFTGSGASLSNLNASQLTTGTVADARLTTNVALLNANQTFTGTNIFNGTIVSTGTNLFSGPNNFNGVNTFTNWANSFTGNFFGNGLVGWIVTNGLTVQAERDHGYMLTSPGLATVTLPLSATLTNGDIVRVSGAGGGGWLVKLNSGQSVVGNFAIYGNGTLNQVYIGGYNGVAASGDGVHLYAVGGGVGSAYGFQGVYASTDSGKTWNQVGATTISGYCSAVACSANGKVVYVQLNSGTVEKSSDSGATWASTGSGTVNNFISCTADGSSIFTGNIACSGDGTHRAKLASGVITVSTNSGATYAVAVTAPAGVTVTCLAASSDCTRLVAGVSSGLFYTSANQGSTWTALTATNQNWSGVWMSADGNRIVATVGSTATISGGVNCFNVSALPTTATNSITGSQGGAVELQYLGNNQFMPVSSTGTIWAN